MRIWRIVGVSDPKIKGLYFTLEIQWWAMSFKKGGTSRYIYSYLNCIKPEYPITFDTDISCSLTTNLSIKNVKLQEYTEK